MKKNYLFTADFSKSIYIQLITTFIFCLCNFLVNAQTFTANSIADWDVFPVGNLIISEEQDADALNGSAIKFTTAVSTQDWFNSLAQTFQNNTPATVNGDSYTISFKHRADADRQIRVQIHGRPTDTYGSADNTYYDQFVSVQQGYQEFIFTFTSTDTQPGNVQVQLYAGGDDSVLYVDDFSIQVSAPMQNEAYTTINDWDVFPVGNLTVSEEQDSDALNGSAIKFTTAISTQDWFNSLAQTFQNNTPATNNGDSYTVSFKHRADADRQLRVQIHGRPTDTFGSDDNTYYDQFVQIQQGYQEFSFTFISSDVVPGSVHVQLFGGGNDSAFYIDDFDVENTGPGFVDGEEPFEDITKWNSYPEEVLREEIISDAEALNGEAFRISPLTSIADLQWFDTGFQILQDAAVREESGKSYKVSFRYRSEANRQFRLSLLSRPLNTFGSDDTPYFGDFLQASTEYQDFNITFTSGVTANSAIYIGFLIGGDDNALLIDNIQIEEFIPAREPTTLYVRQDGSDTNVGTSNTPAGAWKTIAYALSQLVPGDVLLLNDGLYQENSLVLKDINGTAETKTIVRSINKWGAKIEGTTQFETIFSIENSSFIEIDGIEVFNNNNVEFEDWNAGVQSFGSDHVTIKNVYAHDCGCNGISGREGDYFTFENNIVRDNAKTNPFNCSGISVYQPINRDNEPGFHIIIRNNVAFENECRLPFTPLGFDVPTDGNGIILDDFNQTQSEGVPAFTGASLVENNLTFNNGGAGIKIFEVSNATVRNNTAWHNNYVLQEFSSGIGEIGLQAITGPMTVSNNLVVQTFQQSGSGLFLQTAEGGSASFTNNIVVGSNSFEGNAPALQNNIVVSGNQQSFPKFANATKDVLFTGIEDFRSYFALREGSPALDAANDDLAADNDLGGITRPIGSAADVGAFEGVEEGTGPLPQDAFLVAKISNTVTAIRIDGIRDGAYLGSNNPLTKKLSTDTIADETDLSANFTALYDENFLYVLVNVQDSNLQNGEEFTDHGDSIELYLDGDNSRDTTLGTNDFIYRIGYNDDSGLTELIRNDIEGAEAKISDTDGGYGTEFKIPWSKLSIIPSDSLRIGLDVHIIDGDLDQKKKLVWQDVFEDFTTIPSRFGEALLLNLPPPPGLKKVTDSILVDGTQGEPLWSDVVPIELTNNFKDTAFENSNLSANWKSVWDNENLYFFVSVNDDDLRNDSDQWFEDDGIEIYIDADNSKNTTYGSNDYQITIGWDNNDLVEDTKNNLGTGSVAKVIDTDSGYDVEVAIPWTAIGLTPADGNFIGLDVHVNDDDQGGSRSGKIAWFATSDESFRNPSIFGNVFLDADAGVPPNTTGGVFGEIGNSDATHDWSKVDYSNVYKNPIVVMGPISSVGNQPATVAVRNIGGTKFQWRVDEWNYLDGVHLREKASYIVVESGEHELEDGTKFIAGTTIATTDWKTVTFPVAFVEIPVIMPQLTNLKAKQALDVRVRNVSNEGFEVKVQGEERIRWRKVKERIGYIAILQSHGENFEVGQFEVSTTANTVSDQNFRLQFAKNYSNAQRVFLGHDQTTNGSDPGTIRYRNGSLNANSATLFFQEEQSKDIETKHVSERFGYAVFDIPGNLFGQTKISDDSTEDEGPNENEESDTFQITLFPNPASNSITITLSNGDLVENAEVTIFTIFGFEAMKKIQERLGDTIDVSSLTRGLYIVEIEYEGNALRKLMLKK